MRVVCLALLLAACGTTASSDPDAQPAADASRSDAGLVADTGPAADSGAAGDSGPAGDSGAAGDSGPAASDAGSGLPLGADCLHDTDCASQLCFNYVTRGRHVCSHSCAPATAATDCPSPPFMMSCNGMGTCKLP